MITKRKCLKNISNSSIKVTLISTEKPPNIGLKIRDQQLSLVIYTYKIILNIFAQYIFLKNKIDIGFIESYLDPLKVRAEWEGFVSIVDKDKSKILGNLVNSAPNIIKHLPWYIFININHYK